MATDNAGIAPADCAGPSSPPPSLPEGWLAQWEGSSRKWYFVQRTTGKSQWEVPTEPLVPTPSTTPLPESAGPYPGPQSPNDPAAGANTGGAEVHGDGTERGLLTNKLFGTQNNTSFMQGHSGGQGSGNPNSQPGGHGSVTQMAGGFLGRVANHALNGKPGSQQQQGGQPNTQTHGYGGGSGQGGHSQGILPAIGHSLFGQGHHQQQPNQFNYSSSGQTPSTYTGSAPQYQAPGQTENQPPLVLQNPGTPSNNPHAQQQHGSNFGQQVGVDAHGSLSSQFASRPPLPGPPPGQPPSHIAPPPGLSSANVSHQYQGTSNTGYPSSTQSQWSQGQPIPADQGHGFSGQGQHMGVGSQHPQGSYGQHPHGQTQAFSSIHVGQTQHEVPTSGAHVPNPAQYGQPQQTNQFGQPVSAPPGLSLPHASQSAGYPPNQQQTPPNPNQANPSGTPSLNHPQAPQGQYQYQNQYSTGAQQAPVYSQTNPGNQTGISPNNPYPTGTTAAAPQTYTSRTQQYDAYKPQAPVGYGASQHVQQQTPPYNLTGNNTPNQYGNQYAAGNSQPQQHSGVPYAGQQYGNQQQATQFGGAPGR